MIIVTPTPTKYGKSSTLIFTFLVSAKKNGVNSKEARLNLNSAKELGGNSCKVTLATTKLAPQMAWAKNRAINGKYL